MDRRGSGPKEITDNDDTDDAGLRTPGEVSGIDIETNNDAEFEDIPNVQTGLNRKTNRQITLEILQTSRRFKN